MFLQLGNCYKYRSFSHGRTMMLRPCSVRKSDCTKHAHRHVSLWHIQIWAWPLQKTIQGWKMSVHSLRVHASQSSFIQILLVSLKLLLTKPEHWSPSEDGCEFWWRQMSEQLFLKKWITVYVFMQELVPNTHEHKHITPGLLFNWFITTVKHFGLPVLLKYCITPLDWVCF